MITEIKQKIVRFGAIATPYDDEATDSYCKQWAPLSDRIRVFGGSASPAPGVSSIKFAGPVPTLREVFQDHYKTLRGQGLLVLAPSSLTMNYVVDKIMDHAASNRMAVSWAFYARDGDKTVIGFTPSVVKLLSEEVPDSILFDANYEWSNWLMTWMSKYMMKHRVFEVKNLIQPGSPDEFVQPTIKVPALLAPKLTSTGEFDKKMDQVRDEIIASQEKNKSVKRSKNEKITNNGK